MVEPNDFLAEELVNHLKSIGCEVFQRESRMGIYFDPSKWAQTQKHLLKNGKVIMTRFDFTGDDSSVITVTRDGETLSYSGRIIIATPHGRSNSIGLSGLQEWANDFERKNLGFGSW